MDHRHNPEAASTGPATPWLGAGALLAGVGTVLLGPILPVVETQWRLTDAAAGLLLFAKFTGAFLGGVSVPRRLRHGVLSGTLLACVGFSLFPLCSGLTTGMAAMFISGIGVGQLIASTNILAGRRYTTHTGSALASLNFFWSFGAVGAGLLAAAFLPRFGVCGLLFSLGGAFLLTGLGGFAQTYRSQLSQTTLPSAASSVERSTLVHFGLLLFLYGGLETSLSGWLTTYTVRYAAGAQWLAGQSGIVLLWAALTAGRALSSVALRYAAEATVQRIGLAFSFVFIGGLAVSHQTAFLALWCILLGLSLAPFFPATFALLLRRSPTPREAGTVLAVSGLGAAAFPWLMGQVSTYSGSLRVAMAVPMALALLLLVAGLPRQAASPAAVTAATS